MSNPSIQRRNASLTIEYLALASLKPPPDVPRRHSKSQIKSISKSIRAFGFNVPILVDGDGRIIAGLARAEAAKGLGLNEVPAIRIEHLTDAQVKGFMLAENRLAELATWDDQALGKILLELTELDLDFEIEAIGFSAIEIDLRIGKLESPPEQPKEPQVDEGPAVTKAGDLWALGSHRLFCGSALETVSWARLMDEEEAAVVVTDPPYNIKIDGFVSGLGQHRHREFAMGVGEFSSPEFTDFLQTAMRQAYRWSAAGSVHYWAMDWRHHLEIGVAGNAVYDRFLNLCVWQKNQAGMGSFYRAQHELFFVFAKGGAPSRNNVQLGRFGRSRSNVWTYPSAASLARTSEEGNPLAMHPTVKPLALVTDMLLDASARGDIVVDPFAGSGTTVIAAEKLGRRARAIELDPLYCDTIIRRWRNWTGEDAIRLSDGMTFSALEVQGAEVRS